MSSPTFTPDVYVDVTAAQYAAWVAAGKPVEGPNALPVGAIPIVAAGLNRLGVALQVASQDLLLKAAAADVTSLTATVAGKAAAADVTALTAAVNTNTTNIAAKYTKPGTGIPLGDLASAVIANFTTPAQVDSRIAALIGGAPAALDTLKEIADQLALDETAAQAIAGRLTTAEQNITANATAITANGTAITARYIKPGTGIPAADLNVPSVATAVAADTALSGTYQQTLPVVAAVTAAATLVGDRHTPVDASGGALTVMLPTPTRVGQQVRVEKIDATTNAVTISGTLRGAADTLSLRYTSEVRTLTAESLTSWRVASGNTPKAGLDATYASTTDSRLTDQRTPTDGSVTDAKVASGAAIAQGKIAGLTASLTAKADLVGGVIPTAQIPALALVDTVTVASQAAMLALTSAQVQRGDIAVRTDGAGTFVLNAADPSQLSSWVRLNAPTDVVTSVNGQQGTVVLSKTDVGLGNVDNTTDSSKPISTATQAALTPLQAAMSSSLNPGEATMERLSVTQAVGLQNGVVHLTYFTARRAETITQVRVYTNATPAGATPTLARMGIYSVAADGALTLIAATVSDTSLFSAANTQWTRTLTTSLTKTSGQRYAVAVLVSSAAALPSLGGLFIIGAAEAALPPRASGSFAASDLPASISAASVADNARFVYASLLP